MVKNITTKQKVVINDKRLRIQFPVFKKVDSHFYTNDLRIQYANAKTSIILISSFNTFEGFYMLIIIN